MVPTKALRLPNAGTKPSMCSLSNQMSDMSILEQHFYIDAGVNLPTKSLIAFKNSNVAHKIPFKNVSNLGGNITDDDKVNLRKLPHNDDVSDKGVKRINKRYSSVLSETCLLKQEQKVSNRRSLNLSSNYASRIPVSKAKSKCEKVQSEEQLVEYSVSNAAKISHLPVFVG
ncbi:hypothetical protein FQR65_LT19758 [Abscondita terminalis]|nr:hypothetical protein FQR65_LT19758 [Abscondita terminalis]